MKITVISDTLSDEQGNPLTLWRGDVNDYDQFDRNQIRENGFFFTPDQDIAQKYVGRDKTRKPNKYHVNAPKILNLMDDTPLARKFIMEWAKNYDDPDSVHDGWIDRQSGETMDPVEAVQGGQLFDWEGDWSGRRWKNLQSAAEDAGYDAVILPDWDSEKGVFPAYVVFKPENIKRQAMPAVSLRNSEGIDAKGTVDLYFEKMRITKDQFVQEPSDTDFIYRPRGWLGTESNWFAWQQYVQFVRRLTESAFPGIDLKQVGGILFKNPDNPAARKIAKMFVRVQQQVFSSQSIDEGDLHESI